MAEENIGVTEGNEQVGASAEAHAGTEVTDTSVSANAGVSAEAHANVENTTEVVEGVNINSEAHATAETKKVCKEKTDKAGKPVLDKAGKPQEECKTIKVHKKLEGTKVEDAKKK